MRDDDHVHQVLKQGADALVRVARVIAQLDLGIVFDKDLGHGAQVVVHGIIGQADAKHGVEALVFRQQVVSQLVVLKEDFSDFAQKMVAGVRQYDRLGVPLKQRDAQIFFQDGNVPAERRLGDIKMFRRHAEIQIFGQNGELT
jgi:hypothetical protein